MAFLLLIFAAVYARRFERRSQDLGIFGFMAFFLTQFARIQPHQLPQLAGALGIAFTAAAGARFCLMPTTACGILPRLRAAFDRRLYDVLQATADLLTDGRTTSGGLRRLERSLDRLHACALLIQDFLREDASTPAPDVVLV